MSGIFKDPATWETVAITDPKVLAGVSDAAQKFDGNKNRLELIAPEFVEGVGNVMTYGAGKYSAGNWAKGMKWSRPFGAALRHLYAWARGEKADPETGLSHLYHAACCIMFLAVYEQRGIGTDDRTEIGMQP